MPCSRVTQCPLQPQQQLEQYCCFILTTRPSVFTYHCLLFLSLLFSGFLGQQLSAPSEKEGIAEETSDGKLSARGDEEVGIHIFLWVHPQSKLIWPSICECVNIEIDMYNTKVNYSTERGIPYFYIVLQYGTCTVLQEGFCFCHRSK